MDSTCLNQTSGFPGQKFGNFTAVVFTSDPGKFFRAVARAWMSSGSKGIVLEQGVTNLADGNRR